MKYRSVFDIIGPVMIGPSSSHTAGAVRIGQLARKLFGQAPVTADIHLYGSFARTYRGHATDVALLAGILGLEASDLRIPGAFKLARDEGVAFTFHTEDAVPPHPNSVMIRLKAGAASLEVHGISIGGGMVQITSVDRFQLRLSGDSPALLIFHKDAYGAIASVTQILGDARVNVSHMEVSRTEKGRDALMVIETDQQVTPDIIHRMARQPNIHKIITLDA
ncbi:MAG: L-serine ammonia-lyase, iron-sulfur-dependent, subunit beta [Clostridiales bacterium]|jgi:L-serine dehydratase|nr:L-serine ammonia-lyase, iron-sulfur-dependent, subunit beta [Clostridiales bacterium]